MKFNSLFLVLSIFVTFSVYGQKSIPEEVKNQLLNQQINVETLKQKLGKPDKTELTLHTETFTYFFEGEKSLMLRIDRTSGKIDKVSWEDFKTKRDIDYEKLKEIDQTWTRGKVIEVFGLPNMLYMDETSSNMTYNLPKGRLEFRIGKNGHVEDFRFLSK